MKRSSIAGRKSKAVRKGRFTLDAEGTLDGEVEERSRAYRHRPQVKGCRQVSRRGRPRFSRTAGKRLPTAEVSDLHWENLRTTSFQ